MAGVVVSGATVSWRWRAAFVGALTVHLVVLYAPSTPSAAGIVGVDKIGHALVFAAAGYTAIRQNWRARSVIGALGAHAVVSELLQHFLLAGRSGDPLDMVADAVGALLGVHFAARRHRGGSS